MSAPAPNSSQETGTMTSPEHARTSPAPPARAARRTAAWCLAAALLLPAGAARAQAAGPAGAAGPGDTAAVAEPELVSAPRQFRLALTGGGMFWDQTRSRAPQDAAAWGLDVERLLLRYLSVRLGATYLPTRVEDPAGATDVHGWLFEVSAEPRLALPSLERIGVIPFVTAGAGSIIFDPRQSGLTTRSQNAFELGAGVEARIAPTLGARAEWRTYTASLQTLFDPTRRDGVTRRAQRLLVSLYWAF